MIPAISYALLEIGVILSRDMSILERFLIVDNPQLPKNFTEGAESRKGFIQQPRTDMRSRTVPVAVTYLNYCSYWNTKIQLPSESLICHIPGSLWKKLIKSSENCGIPECMQRAETHAKTISQRLVTSSYLYLKLIYQLIWLVMLRSGMGELLSVEDQN